MTSRGYDVTLRRNVDGVTCKVHFDSEWDETDEFLWTDGNFACDCNRHLLFCRAMGIPEDDDRPCGDTAYMAIKATLHDGTEITLDDGDD